MLGLSAAVEQQICAYCQHFCAARNGSIQNCGLSPQQRSTRTECSGLDASPGRPRFLPERILAWPALQYGWAALLDEHAQSWRYPALRGGSGGVRSQGNCTTTRVLAGDAAERGTHTTASHYDGAKLTKFLAYTKIDRTLRNFRGQSASACDADRISRTTEPRGLLTRNASVNAKVRVVITLGQLR